MISDVASDFDNDYNDLNYNAVGKVIVARLDGRLWSQENIESMAPLTTHVNGLAFPIVKENVVNFSAAKDRRSLGKHEMVILCAKNIEMQNKEWHWPGLFSFVIGVSEVAAGAFMCAKGNPAAGKALMWDGWNRMIDGVIENAEDVIIK